MAPRDSSTTRTSLLRAATAEFAAYGIAGARVDRIAAASGYNKNLIYVHFGNKEQLFDSVYEAAVEEILNAAPFDAENLPGYAGALFDFHLAHPHLMRLARWHSLERRGAVLPIAEKANAAKIRALAAAQGEGKVDAGLPPEKLLALLISLTSTWSEGSPEATDPGESKDGNGAGDGAGSAEEIAAKRHAVVVSVGRLVRVRGEAER